MAIAECTACNLRSGPGLQYMVVGIAHEGDSFEPADTDGWLPIKYKGEVAWVADKYIKG